MATVGTDPQTGQRVLEDDRNHVIHSWSVQSALSPIAVAGAEGRHFWDFDGKHYLDFASQLVNVSIGHQHLKVVAAIKEQAETLCTIAPPMATEARSTPARLLSQVTPGTLTMSFFTNGGAEANENAIKLARWYTGRHKIVARYRSYHGATGGGGPLTPGPPPPPPPPPLPRAPPAAAPPSPASRASSGCSTPTPTVARPATPTRARSARARRTSRSSSSTRARKTSPP